MSDKFFNYYIQGFVTLISPGHVADCDVYFRTIVANVPQIRGVELFKKDRSYLGYWHPENIPLETKREILKYIKNNPKKWMRVYGRVPA